MERARRIQDLWSWLPAFRVVAETEHLPTAARTMRLSPSALSRSVTLLEDALGCVLFERSHRRMRLNAAGIALLAAVREAMRRIDDGVSHALGGGSDHVTISGAAAWVRLLALPVLGATLARLQLVDGAEGHAVSGALLRGEVDIAIGEGLLPTAGIEVDRLGPVAWAVCRATRSKAPLPYASCRELPGPWPSELPRRIAFETPRLEAVLDACVSGAVTAVLPVVIARGYQLHLARKPRLPDSQLWIARRRPLTASALDEVVAAIRARAATVLDPHRTTAR